MSDNENTQGKWYVIHTYSGYENKVKANIEKIVENRNLQDLIFEIKVPMEEQLEEKDGRRRAVMRKITWLCHGQDDYDRRPRMSYEIPGA